jgi:hypothetical protein
MQTRCRADAVTEMTTALVISALRQAPEANRATPIAAAAALEHSR